MKKFTLICFYFLSTQMFPQDMIVLYNKSGIMLSYREEIINRHTCSDGFTRNLSKFRYIISNNSGKTVNVDYNFSLIPSLVGCNNNELPWTNPSQGASGYSTVVYLKNGDDEIGVVTAWVNADSTPYWSLSPIFLNSTVKVAPPKTSAKKPTSNTKTSLVQDDFRVNPKSYDSENNKLQKIKEQQEAERQNYINMVNAEKQRQNQERERVKLENENQVRRQNEYAEQQRAKEEQAEIERNKITQRLEKNRQADEEVKNSVDGMVDKLTEIYKQDSDERHQKWLNQMNSTSNNFQTSAPVEDEMTLMEAEIVYSNAFKSQKEGKYKKAWKEFVKASDFKGQDFTYALFLAAKCAYKEKSYFSVVGLIENFLETNQATKEVHYYLAQSKYQIAISDLSLSKLAQDFPDRFTNYCENWLDYKYGTGDFIGNDGEELDVLCGEYIFTSFAKMYDDFSCKASADFCRKLALQWKCYRLDPSEKSCGKKLSVHDVPKCSH